MQLQCMFGALAILAILIAPDTARSRQAEETGTVILRAIDVESGEPIADVSFAIENSLAEMWAETLGTSDADGQLRLESKQQRGYFYSVYPMPKGYKVAGLDAVPTSIKPGEITEHRFHLRKLDANVKVPDLVPRPDVAEQHLPELHKNNIHSQTTREMPGFEDQPVRFSSQDDAIQIAEDIFRNGKRLRAAIEDELLYFQKAEGEKAGDIKKINDLVIIVRSKGWVVWCRTEDCMKLSQKGFRFHFDSNFEKWNLYVPDYLHPDFGR